jgi:23S rRNA pseudouridine955/2504/2580 synthase
MRPHDHSSRPPKSSPPTGDWIVRSGEQGRLGSFLEPRLRPASNKKIKQALEANSCLVNERVERFASRLLRVGDRVQFRWPSAPTAEASILFEDEDFLVVNKPPGWVCDDSLLKRLSSTSGTLWLVHRLDRDTSGALLLAKSPSIRKRFEELFREHLVHKLYWAVVDGTPVSSSGEQRQPLIRKESGAGQQRWGPALPGEGLPAQTRWHLVKSGADCALLACEPLTGRTHQIRVHLALMGHPILGDRHYCAHFRCLEVPPRVLLHALELQFPHPRTGLPTSIRAPLPPDFSHQLKRLHLDS